MMIKKKWQIALASMILAAAALSCSLGGTGSQPDGSGQNLVLDYQPGYTSSPAAAYQLSPDQSDALINLGYPDRFLIFFFADSGSGGELEQVRMETWHYDQLGWELVFRNGELTKEQNTEPIQMEGLGRTIYNPELFSFGMGLDELTAAVAQTDFYRLEMNEELVEGGELIYFQGLVVGLAGNRLQYVETLPLGNAGLPYSAAIQSADPAAGQPVRGRSEGGEDEEQDPGTEEAASAVRGEAIIFTGIKDGNYDIFSLDLDSGEVVRQTHSEAVDAYPACPPSGDKIAFVSDISGEQQIYLMDPDGGNMVQATDFPGRKDFLTWFSDRRVVFWDGEVEGAYVLLHLEEGWRETMDPEDGQAYTADLAVAPDGSYTALAEAPDGKDTEIVLINLETGEQILVTDNEGIGETRPVWSPDSSRLLFTRHEGADSDLWIYTLETGAIERLTWTPQRSELSGCWLPAESAK